MNRFMSRQEEKGKKESVAKDVAIVRKAIKMFQKVDSATVPLIITQGILTAVQPFIMIFLAGLLLDALYEGKEIKKMVMYALIGIIVKLVIGLVDHYLGKIKWTKYRNVSSYQGMLMSNKMMTMDYEYIEDEEVQKKIRKQKEYSDVYNGAYFVMFMKLEIILQRLISVVISTVVVIPLFFKTGTAHSTVEHFINSPIFSLMLLLIIGCGMFCSIYSMKKLQQLGKESQEHMMNLSRRFFYYFDNFLDGYERGKDVRIFPMKDLIEKENEILLHNVNQNAEKMKKERWKFEKMNQPISTLTGCLVYLFVGLRALIGAITIGNIVSYAGCIMQFITSFAELLTNISGLRVNNQYLEELLEFLELEPVKEQGTLPVEKRRDERYVIEFRHVYFAYPRTKNYVIEDLNMTFNIGEKMAVVGKNGSGKTTFIKLLCRLYDPTKGEILLNGIDIRKYDYKEYLKLFSVVFQDSKMYAFAVANNIAAAEKVDEEQVSATRFASR